MCIVPAFIVVSSFIKDLAVSDFFINSKLKCTLKGMRIVDVLETIQSDAGIN